MKFALSFFAVLSFAGFALVRVNSLDEACFNGECVNDLICESNVCKIKAGGDCAADVSCVTGATCTGGKCVCVDTVISKTDNTKCLLKVDATCTADNCIMGASCTGTGTKKCTCLAKSEANAAKDKCLKYVGGQCTAAADCANSDHTDCTENKCTCKPNYTGDENSACKLKLEQECTNTDDCYGKNAECKDGTPKKCTCKTGYFADGQYCAKKVGEACTVKDDCPMNGECKEEKCACMANYKEADNGFCKLKLEQECTNADDCYGKNAECKDGTPKKCTCKTGYFADDQHCAKKVGEECTGKDDCPMNGECKEQKCACMANYKEADNGFCISESSGSVVVGSVLLLLVAFVTSRLL